MAVRNPINVNNSGGNVHSSFRNYLWSGLLNTDSGNALECGDFTDKTVHMYGTWGVGGSVTLYGSNNPADVGVDPASGTWVPLTDAQGNVITKTANSIETVLESPLYLSVKVTAGDGATNLNVSIAAKQYL